MASNGSFNTSAYQNRHLTFSWVEKSQSIENNTTTISWTLKGGGSASGHYLTQNVTVKIAGEVVFEYPRSKGQIKLYNGTDVASGTYTFNHDAEGKKDFTVYVEAGIYVWEPNCNGTKTFSLNTIPRASTLAASNGTLGEPQTLTINRAASTFKHRLTYRCGDTAEYIAGSATGYSTATSISWTPRIGLAEENTTGTSVSVTLTLYTYTSDGTHVGTTTEVITCAIPVSVKPSVTINWEDITGAADTYGQPVQGISKLKITLDVQTRHGSNIAVYTLTANGVKYAKATATTEALKDAGQSKISATVKDQRGRSGSNIAMLNVLAYTLPVVSLLTVHRCDKDGTEHDQGNHVKVTFSATVTSLNGKNPPTYKLRYKKSSDSNYTEIPLTALDSTYTVTEYDYIFEADGNSSYDVEVTASDNHGTATRSTSASTAFSLLNFHESGTAMGVGKGSERENAVEFGLPIYDQDDGEIVGIPALINLFLPVGSIVVRYDTKNPGTLYPGTTWTQIQARVLRAGAAGSVGAEGNLADGSGRTYIDVAVWRRTA